DMLPRPSVDIDVVVPYTRGDLVSRVHTQGELVSEEFLAEGTRLVARVDETLASELAAARQ
ncbi:MAG: GTPase HflX, partial [Dermabacter sp.]|nr:GTPase HflX [Dermabacter sp.]